MYTHLCNNSRVEAADKKAHSAAFTRKSPAKFHTFSDTGHHSRGIHFYETRLSDSAQHALRFNYCYGSDTYLSCLQSASQKSTPGYMDFGNAPKEQPVASCHQAIINTIKNLLCSYSQMPRHNLLLLSTLKY